MQVRAGEVLTGRAAPGQPSSSSPHRADPVLLTISTTHQPATDLGFLLHKNPDRVHTADLPFGRAHVVYPEAATERCTVALLVEVDPIGLVRDRKGPKGP
jgi:RNA repair, ligase-Pnkp-associating, region of Hen1